MFSLYIQPAANFLPPQKRDSITSTTEIISGEEVLGNNNNININEEDQEINNNIQPPASSAAAVAAADSSSSRDPVAFLYYSIVLTTLTVIVAIVIGVIQLLSMIASAVNPKGKFWDGVQTAGDYYDAIGGGICGCFVIVGILSVFTYNPWKRWMVRRHGMDATTDVIIAADEEEGGGGFGHGHGHGHGPESEAGQGSRPDEIGGIGPRIHTHLAGENSGTTSGGKYSISTDPVGGNTYGKDGSFISVRPTPDPDLDPAPAAPSGSRQGVFLE